MKTSIEFLPEEKQRELRKITNAITEKFSKKIDMVILYGSYARNTWVEDRYIDERGTAYSYISDFDILVVTTSESRAKNINYANEIRKTVDIKTEGVVKTPISMIFHGYDYICQMLAEKRYFFCDVYHEGIILDNNGNRHFKEPKDISYSLRAEKSEQYFEDWFGTANGFLEGYNFYFNRAIKSDDMKEYKLASFNLHQSTERFYMCVLLVFTDYKGKTHDLKVLDKACSDEDRRFTQAFPRTNKEEKDLFQLLREAYIGSRYDMNFKITKEELENLVKRVEILKGLVEIICKEKINHFKEVAEKFPDKRIVSKKPDLTITEPNYGSPIIRISHENGDYKKLKKLRTEVKKEKSLEIAKSLLENKVDIGIISKSTGLRIEEIERLKD